MTQKQLSKATIWTWTRINKTTTTASMLSRHAICFFWVARDLEWKQDMRRSSLSLAVGCEGHLIIICYDKFGKNVFPKSKKVLKGTCTTLPLHLKLNFRPPAQNINFVYKQKRTIFFGLCLGEQNQIKWGQQLLCRCNTKIRSLCEHFNSIVLHTRHKFPRWKLERFCYRKVSAERMPRATRKNKTLANKLQKQRLEPWMPKSFKSVIIQLQNVIPTANVNQNLLQPQQWCLYQVYKHWFANMINTALISAVLAKMLHLRKHVSNHASSEVV